MEMDEEKPFGREKLGNHALIPSVSPLKRKR
jgi:hypothetical protein